MLGGMIWKDYETPILINLYLKGIPALPKSPNMGNYQNWLAGFIICHNVHVSNFPIKC